MTTTHAALPIDHATPKAALSGPRVILHLEGAAVMAVAIAAYVSLGGGLWFFLATILVPDVSLLGYLVGKRVGALVYDAVHNYVAPLALAGLASALGWHLGLLIAAVWVAHVGMDRLAGYGLKYESGFRSTHLDRV